MERRDIHVVVPLEEMLGERVEERRAVRTIKTDERMKEEQRDVRNDAPLDETLREQLKEMRAVRMIKADERIKLTTVLHAEFACCRPCARTFGAC
ncbi:hypothetical protein [Azospirillum doebereinerae]